ncbi:MAG: recombinase family protein [Deltaproteobacteria bacterium]|nr:recombinase family protein [Deltaproteobacteria bacterium]
MRVLFVEKQWSARQVAEFTGWSKTSVIGAIANLGLHRDRKPYIKEPYGWKLLNGNLVPHIRERKVIKTIMRLKSDGYTANRIATFLNERVVPTKNRKRWEHKTIKAILERERRA